MRKLVLGAVLAMALVCTVCPEASGAYIYRRRYYRVPDYRSYVWQHRYYRPFYYYRPYRWYGGWYGYPSYPYYYPSYYYYQPPYYWPGYGLGGYVTVWW